LKRIITKTQGLFKGNTNNTLIQLFRYTFVGGVAYVVDFGLLYSLTEFLNLHYLISAAISFILGLITNYILSIAWVFSKRKLNSKPLEFVIFTSVGIIGLGLNELFIWFFTEWVHFHYLVSKLVSTVFVYLWNFVARKYILFR